MAHIVVRVTQMGFSVHVNKAGIIADTGLSIVGYSNRFVHRQYDKTDRIWKIVNEYFHYCHKTSVIYFPRYDLENFLTYLTVHGLTYTLDHVIPVQGADVSFSMMDWVDYKNDNQKGAVEFLTNESNGALRGLALRTGEGKSVSYVWALQKIGKRSLITMTSRLEQWVDAITKYATVTEDDIYLIQGIGSLEKLFKNIDKDIKPKIILASTKTIRLYMDYGPAYQHLPHPSMMCEELDIGIMASDENHEHLCTNLMAFSMFNPAVWIPITATFVASDPFVKNIFGQLVPENKRFSGGNYSKFVDVIAYDYKGAKYLIKPYHYTKRGMYSQTTFEAFLLGKGHQILDTLIKDAFIPIIREHYIDIAEDGEKFLFICGTRALCDHLKVVFSKAFPNKSVTAFHSGMPEHLLKKFDMIISTQGSAGTGRDISGLRTCFSFESTASQVRNEQQFGRLRGPPQMMNTPRFTYLFFSAIQKHVAYHQSKLFLFSNKALSIKTRVIN